MGTTVRSVCQRSSECVSGGVSKESTKEKKALVGSGGRRKEATTTIYQSNRLRDLKRKKREGGVLKHRISDFETPLDLPPEKVRFSIATMIV